MFSLRPRPPRRNEKRVVYAYPNDKSISTEVSEEVSDESSQLPLAGNHCIESEESSLRFTSIKATRPSPISTQSRLNPVSNTSSSNIPGIPLTSSPTCPLHHAMKLSGILEEMTCNIDDVSSICMPRSLLSFPRQEVVPCTKQPSALSAMLSSPSAPIINPFANFKASAQVPPDADSMVVLVYFPHADYPAGEPLELHVGTEVNVATLMGLALWTYWERFWLPPLPLTDRTDTWPAGAASADMTLSKWRLRLVRDEFVDYENEAPDPSDKVRLLGALDFALLINNNDIISEDRISRRRSQSQSRQRFSVPGLSVPKRYSLPFRLGESSTSWYTPIKLFYVKEINDDEQPVSIECSIHASMNDVLDIACTARGIEHSELYILMCHNVRRVLHAVPLERRASSLADKTEFVLVIKS